jgi:hypothetical protein
MVNYMANKVVCMRWGDLYTQEHVDALRKQVEANCSVPFEFVCIENADALSSIVHKHSWKFAQQKHFRGLDNPDMRAQGAWNDYERDDCGGLTHYKKLLLFGLDVDCKFLSFDPDDTILFLDLDVVITKDIAPFFALDNERPWIVKSYWFDGEREEGEWQRQFHLRRCPYFNSSVLVWKPGQNRPIWDLINENLDQVFFQYGVNDNFMFHQFGPWSHDETRRNHFNVYPKGMITSEQYSNGDVGIIHSFEGMSMKDKEDRMKCFL